MKLITILICVAIQALVVSCYPLRDFCAPLSTDISIPLCCLYATADTKNSADAVCKATGVSKHACLSLNNIGKAAKTINSIIKSKRGDELLKYPAHLHYRSSEHRQRKCTWSLLGFSLNGGFSSLLHSEESDFNHHPKALLHPETRQEWKTLLCNEDILMKISKSTSHLDIDHERVDSYLKAGNFLTVMRLVDSLKSIDDEGQLEKKDGLYSKTVATMSTFIGSKYKTSLRKPNPVDISNALILKWYDHYHDCFFEGLEDASVALFLTMIQ